MRPLSSNRFIGFFFLIVVVGTQPNQTTAENVWLVGTGDEHSASWQFVLELSKLWQIVNPDEEVVFVPRHEKDIFSRIRNLKIGHSKMVIAPINAISEDQLATEEIKIATILWKTYLVPMVFLKNTQTVTLDYPEIWFVTEGSSIIPAYLNQFSTFEAISPLLDTVETSVVQDMGAALPTENRLEESSENVKETTDRKTGIPNLFDSTSDSNETTDPDEDPPFDTGYFTESDATASDNTSDIFQPSAQLYIDDPITIEPWSRSLIGSVIVTENTEKIRDFFLGHPDGVFFYEMLGPVRHLQQAMTIPLELIDLDPTVIHVLTGNLPWVYEVNFANSNLKTVGMQMAIFVKAKEDIEFTETLIKLLRQPPRSFFQKSYIMENLSTSVTKGLSPFVLHPGTLKYFNLD